MCTVAIWKLAIVLDASGIARKPESLYILLAHAGDWGDMARDRVEAAAWKSIRAAGPHLSSLFVVEGLCNISFKSAG